MEPPAKVKKEKKSKEGGVAKEKKPSHKNDVPRTRKVFDQEREERRAGKREKKAAKKAKKEAKKAAKAAKVSPSRYTHSWGSSSHACQPSIACIFSLSKMVSCITPRSLGLPGFL